jgi:syntaxin 5
MNSQSSSSLFDASQKLTIQIKDEITGINFEINDLKNNYQAKIKNSKNTESEDKNCDGVLQILNLRIAEMSHRFKDYLTIRSKAIEKHEERKSKFNFVGEKDQISNRRVNSFMEFSKRPKNGKIFDTGIHNDEEDGLMESGNGNDNERSQKFGQIEMIENRSKNLENIKEVLSDINQIFVKFSEIVNTQQLMVERIDTDTEMALLNAERGKKELSEHYQNVSSYRNLIFKIFMILIIFATLYIIFVV